MASSGSDVANSLGFEIVQYKEPVMTCYKYINENVNIDAGLWEFRSELSYTSFGCTTDWHDSWTECKYGRILLKFHLAGNPKRLKTATLVPAGGKPSQNARRFIERRCGLRRHEENIF